MKTKLTEIINIGIEKGFDCFNNKKHGWEIREGFIVNFYGAEFSLTDLLFSPDSNLMQALFGEEDEWYITECTCGGLDFHLHGPDIHKKECAKVKANRGKTYYQIQLLPLNDQERISYIANALGEELDGDN